MILTRLAPLMLAALPACGSLGGGLPDESPPLLEMVEPPSLHSEPDDEEARRALPLGGFTGVHVADGRRSLAALDEEPEGVLVQRVVENSPGDAAGLTEGDLLLAVTGADGAEHELHWPSEWRAVELAARDGSVLEVVFDRAGVEGDTGIRVAPRVRATERNSAERYREEQRVGVVLRTATEVEARAAGLAAGAGAVIVGLTRESPWRHAGLRFRDLLVSVDGTSVAHPQVVLDAIREAEEGATIEIEVVRGGRRETASVPVSRREQDLREVSLVPFFSYESERGESELSILLGLIRKRETAAAWEWRILWLFTISGGDADRLEDAE